MYRVSHSKEGKVILLWWGYRFWFLLIFLVLHVHEIGTFMPNSSVFIVFMLIRKESKSISSAEPNYFLQFEMRHPVVRSSEIPKMFNMSLFLNANLMVDWSMTSTRLELVQVGSCHWDRQGWCWSQLYHVLPVS